MISTMKTAPILYIVTDFPKSHDSLRYAEAATKLGCNPSLITHAQYEIISSGDAVILRGSPKNTEAVLRTLRHIEAVGAFCLTTSTGWVASKDRYDMYVLLKDALVKTPYTAASASEYLENAGLPAVIKLSDSNQGRGVSVADTSRSLLSFSGTLENINCSFVIQEYLETEVAEDYRYFVVGDTVIAAMKRTAKEGEFRSNLSLGGVASSVSFDDETASMAVNAARALSLKVAGVDIMMTKTGPVVIEVNSSPGLGIEEVTGIDVAGSVVEELVGSWGK